MGTKFGGHGLSSFINFASFCFPLNIPFRLWTIVHGVKIIEFLLEFFDFFLCEVVSTFAAIIITSHAGEVISIIICSIFRDLVPFLSAGVVD